MGINARLGAAPLWPYATAHLGEQCRTISDLVDMIQEYIIRPECNQDKTYLHAGSVQGEIERLSEVLDAEILYLGRVLDDMRSAAILAKRKGRK